MNNKFRIVSLIAALSAGMSTTSIEAGTWPGFQRMDGRTNSVNPVTAASTTTTNTARLNRQGADDPANHDLNDDRGGANQPGDDRGRHHGRHRGRGR